MSACTSGNYCSYQNGTVMFYQAMGKDNGTGTWSINWNGFGGYQDEPSIEYFPVMANAVLRKIRYIVSHDRNVVLVHPEAAVILFLKGTIKPEQLDSAKKNNYCIEVQNVVLDGKLITVRIVRSFAYYISSEDGTIVF